MLLYGIALLFCDSRSCELATPRQAMSREAKETGQYVPLGEVAKAEDAAK